MTSAEPASPIVDEKIENPKLLGWAGGLLFILGLGAAFLVYIEGNNTDQIRMVLNAAILLSLGYPMLLYVRALKKIAALEQRITILENPSALDTPAGEVAAHRK